ncbi:hypothetical protein K435DRAFT_778915 [Dendrothele bispora CBS 962.96]|uniref:DUF6533 domain-containing protein n=1 Tax=Dendrothele bispora (strain CBS 962.96) TaxID=1314807 RepID=A0A4S8M1G6_DENBC|nr:hypothetical protein K435DRAFT_778915 [Dendrothele bispora CBS 962.96]
MPSRLIRDVEAGSGAALFFQLWDTLITFDDEVEFIWPKPTSSWIKWVFLFARYFSLATHICSRAIELSITYNRPLNENTVRIWFSLQGVVALIVFMGAELVMMARVYALYNQNKRVAFGFIILLLFELLGTILGTALNFPGRPFDTSSVITETPRSFMYFGIPACVSELIILTLSVKKYVQGRWMKSRIISLMIRDGTVAFGVLFFMLVLIMTYHLLKLEFSTTAYAWMITFVSVTECRLILNMQQLPLLEQRYTITPELTSVPPTNRTMSYEMTVMINSTPST